MARKLIRTTKTAYYEDEVELLQKIDNTLDNLPYGSGEVSKMLLVWLSDMPYLEQLDFLKKLKGGLDK